MKNNLLITLRLFLLVFPLSTMLASQTSTQNDTSWWGPMLKATERKEIKRLIGDVIQKNKKKINTKNGKKQTILHRAAIKGKTILVEELLEQHESVTINAKDDENMTPFYCAVEASQVEVVKVFFAYDNKKHSRTQKRLYVKYASDYNNWNKDGYEEIENLINTRNASSNKRKTKKSKTSPTPTEDTKISPHKKSSEKQIFSAQPPTRTPSGPTLSGNKSTTSGQSSPKEITIPLNQPKQQEKKEESNESNPASFLMLLCVFIALGYIIYQASAEEDEYYN